MRGNIRLHLSLHTMAQSNVPIWTQRGSSSTKPDPHHALDFYSNCALLKSYVYNMKTITILTNKF